MLRPIMTPKTKNIPPQTHPTSPSILNGQYPAQNNVKSMKLELNTNISLPLKLTKSLSSKYHFLMLSSKPAEVRVLMERERATRPSCSSMLQLTATKRKLEIVKQESSENMM